jgi:ankyrin repeat protein
VLWVLALSAQADPKSDTDEMLRAAARGDATTTEMDLKLGVDPNARDEFNTPALFAAVASGSTDTVRVLLDAGATNLNESHLLRNRSSTPLSLAAWSNNAAMFQLLLAHGADLKADDCSAFRGVIVTNAVDLLRSPLPDRVDVNYRFADGQTPVTISAVHGNLEVLTVLLDSGGNVNARDDTGATALAFAAAQGHEEVVRLLLDRGANVTLRETEGRGPLQAAQAVKDPAVRARISDLLTAHGAPTDMQNRPVDEELLMAAYRGDLPAVKAALRRGADPGVRGIPNATLWLRDVLSASAAHPAVCKYLLEHGASALMRDGGGFSPLFTAATNGDPECITAFIAHGADPNLKAHHGQTPLNMAINARRPPAVIAALLKGGCDPNGPSFVGAGTVLSDARARGEPGNVRLLEAAGAHE